MKKKNPKKPLRNTGDNLFPSLAAALAGLLIGALTLYYHALNSLFTGYYRSEKLLYDLCQPSYFEFLNTLTGTGFILISLLWLAYTLTGRAKADSFIKTRYPRIVVILLSAFFALALITCYYKFFNNDEIEHLHSSWYLLHGHVPYRDFFQHHNPLLWYLLLPFLAFFGDSLASITAARFCMGGLLLGTACLTYLCAATSAKSRETGLVAVTLLFSTVLFMEKGIEIRPDVPQVLFGMASVYFLIRFFRSSSNRDLLLSGLFAAVSFLFLQKTLFLFASYGIVMAYGVYRKELSLRNVAFFVGGALAPLLLFALHLHLTGSFHDYLLTNWEMNRHHLGSRQVSATPLRPMLYSFKQSIFFWILSGVATVFVFVHKNTPREMKMATFLGIFQLLSLQAYSVTFKHYYLFVIPLFCIPASYCLSYAFESWKVRETKRLALILLLLFWAVPFMLIHKSHSNRLQREKINYVLGLTRDTDLVYDGANTFNLFRGDVHYFWYQLATGLPTYNKITGNRFGDYDICQIIWAKRPKIISDVMLDYENCGLNSLYDTTAYPHLYIRRDPSTR
jgi:hypothetical protein